MKKFYDLFVYSTISYPLLMGFAKFAILATFGDLLAKKITQGVWTIKGGRWLERALVWGCLGILLAFVFPLYSAGVDFLIFRNMLPVFKDETGYLISSAFWKSFWMNMLFAFPLMTFHRITDTLIDNRKLFSKWPFIQTWTNIDWSNMWGFVAPTIIWFWIPVLTITFCLPSEFRIMMGALLSICLGAILAFAKLKAKKS